MTAGNLLLRCGNRPNWDPYLLTPSILKAWWSADDHGTGLMTDDGSGLISAWKDRIGGMSITAATTARATWSATAFNSSYSGLTFDGSANCYVSTTLASLPTGATGGEIFALVNQAAGTGAQHRIAHYGGNGAAVDRYISASSGNPTRFFISDNSTNLVDTSQNFSGNFIVGGYWSGTTEGARINGRDTSPATAGTASLNTGTVRFRMGAHNSGSAGNFWRGVIRHLIITTTLTSAGRQKLEGWLAWDAALATTLLPSSHPYYSARP